MKLSTRSTYGMRALVELALASGHGPVSATVIAKRQSLSAAYLEQLLHRLKLHGLLRSIRGPRGGYLLAREPHRITMAEVVRVLDGTNGASGGRPASGRSAPSGGAGMWRPRAEVRDAQRRAQRVTQVVRRCVYDRLVQSLDAITLQDLCEEARADAGEPIDHQYVFHI
ncbi:MAG: Rrf2 family transcriptional regulator [Candidatus Omnitrophota bacterium]|nr:Rrf2 family transcriptional regulator [Candidatus Omnitrophota bacterium]